MAFKYDFAFVAAKELRRCVNTVRDEETPYLELLREKISALTAEIALVRSFRPWDHSNPQIEEILRDLCKERRFCRRVFTAQKLRLRNLNIKFYKFLMAQPGVLQLQDFDFRDVPILRQEWVHFNKLYIFIKTKIILSCRRQRLLHRVSVFRRNLVNNTNIYEYLPIEDTPAELESSEDEFSSAEEASETSFISNIKNKVKFIFSSELRNDSDRVYRETTIPRNASLLVKLKTLIRSFTLFRTNSIPSVIRRQILLGIPAYTVGAVYAYYRNVCENEVIEMQEFAHPQMENADAHGENEPTQLEAGNVTLTEAREPSRAVTAPPSVCRWGELVSSDVKGSYKEMTDRWLKISTFEWSNQQGVNTELNIRGDNTQRTYFDLPYDAIYNINYNVCDVPNTLPFKVHRYWRGDMEVRIQVNSNKFQIGQLQCSWFYEPWLDGKFDLRRNVASASQTDHVIVSAGASNEAVLRIPFKFHLPFISTKKRSDYVAWLRTGRLFVRVLNELTTGTTGPNKCYGAIFIRFLNCEFTGQISGKIDVPSNSSAYPQMNSILGTVAENVGGLLANVLAGNRDAPSDVRPWTGVVPTASHSWCVGNGQPQPLHPLRLQSSGEVRHPDNAPYEMTTTFAARKYGLVMTVKWDKDYGAKHQLFSCNASPEIETSLLWKMSGKAGIEENCYYFPPVTVVTSLYQYWRGTIEFRVDVVASVFHTGRLLIGYVPGATNDTEVTMDDVLSGPHMIFTLQESQQFTYSIPYIADRPMWSKNYMGDYKASSSIPPSRLYMFVLNPLVPMESVSRHVFLNIYMRAGADFEVMIPTQPSLGLGYDARIIPNNTDLIRAISGYAPWYLGTWHSFRDSAFAVTRWGSLSDQIAHFDAKWAKKSSVEAVYYYEIQYESEIVAYLNPAGKWERPKYYIGVWQGKASDTGSYVFLVPCVSEEAAISAAGQYEHSNRDGTAISDTLLSRVGDTTNNPWSHDNIWFVVKTAKPTPPKVIVTHSDDEYVVVAEPQGEREETDTLVTPPSMLGNTKHGEMFFGENFGDLKDLARRFQTYGMYVFDTDDLKKKLGMCACVVPLLPQGLLLDLGTKGTPNQVANRCREGHIPTILSGYRYYRGGMRIRIICPKGFDVQLWVQHRPDRRLRATSIVDCLKVVTAEGVANHGYATYIQDTAVNTIIEIEVPFYQNGCYGLLQRPIWTYGNKAIGLYNESLYMSLGELSLGILALEYESTTLKHSQMVVCYSLADDFAFSTFQGFPPMFVLDNMEAAPQMTNVWKSLLRSATPAVKEAVEPEIRRMTNEVLEGAGSYVTGELKVIQEELRKATLLDAFNAPIVRTFFSHLCQIIANLNLKSCCIGLASVFVELGIWTYNCMDSILQHLIKFFSSLSINWSGNEPNMPDIAEEAVPQSDTACEAASGLITVMWMAICSLSGLAKGIKQDAAWSKMLIHDLGGSLRGANALFTFIRNLFSVMDSMKMALYGYLSPAYKTALLLDAKYADMKAWTDEVLTLEDPHYFQEHRYSPDYKLRVTAAYCFGQEYYKTISDYKGDISKHIITIYLRAKDLYEKVVEFGDDGFVRREPFAIWLYGAAGVGKSHLVHDLSMAMLRHAGISCRVPPICTVNPQANHWDSCQQNPVVCVDDIYNIQQGTILERHLETHYQLFSPVVLIPPKARVDDKGRPYNPEIVVFTSNYEYPVLPNIYNDAIWRRRHVLIDCCADSAKKEGCPHCDGIPVQEVDPSYMRDYHHVKFRFAIDVCKKDAGYTEWMKFDEFSKKLLDKFTIIRDRNTKIYHQRLEEVLAFIAGETDVQNTRYSDLARIFKAKQLKRQQEIIDQSLLSVVKSKKDACFDYLRHNILPWFSKSQIEVANPQMNVEERIGIRMHGNVSFEALEKAVRRQKQSAVYLDFPFYDRKDCTIKETLGTHHYADAFLEKNPQYSVCLPGKFLGVLFSIYFMEYPDLFAVEMFAHAMAEVWRENMSIGLMDYCVIDEKFVMHNFLDICETISTRSACSHICQEMLDLSVEAINTITVCDDVCMWKVPYFRYIFYRKYRDLHPIIQSSLRQGLLDEVPMVFRPKVPVPCIDESKWKQAVSKMIDTAYEWIKKMYVTVWNLFSKIHQLNQYVLPIILSVGTLIGIGTLKYGVCKVASNVTGGPVPSWTPLGPVYMNNPKAWVEPQRGKYETIRSANIRLNNEVPIARAQGECPQLQVAITRLRWNMCRITAIAGDRYLSVESFVVEGRKLLLLAHYLEEFSALPADTRYYFKFHLRKDDSGQFGIPLQLWDLERRSYGVDVADGCMYSNFVVVWLPLQVPECKSLIPFIAEAKQHVGVSSDGMLLKNDGVLVDNLNICRENARPLVIRATENSSRVVLQDMYSYRIQGRGMCGSVLLSTNLERPIVGIHVAGVESGNTRGIAEILTYETFRDLPKSKTDWNTEAIIPDMLDSEFAKINVDTLIFPLGCTDASMTAYQGGKTQYVPSLIHGCFPVETEPNPLSPLDPRLPPGSSPLRDGIAHMGKPPITFPKKDIDDAAFDLRRVIVQNVKPVRLEVGVVSLQDAICGNKDIYGFEPLEWSTSPGFPFRFLKEAGVTSGKKWLFDLTETEEGYKLNKMHERLQKQITYELACRKRGIKPFTIFIDCLKDTCVPVEKCSVPGKTRIFSISPVQYTIVFKQYFLDFMASYQKARLKAEHGIGIDVNSREWTGLATYLQEKGDKIICGDYKNFGPGLMISVAEAACRIILEWYAFHGASEEEQCVRRVLISELLSANHLATNLIYVPSSGIPSGSPITAPLNSLVNSLYIRIIWKYITNLSFRDMHENCNIVTYGDDVCINVSDLMIEQFNTKSMHEAFAKYNIVFTDVDKDGEIIPYHKLDTAQFLKCGFAPHPSRTGIWLAPLDKKSIQGCANWISCKNMSRTEATVSNAEQCLMLAHGWGEEYYNYVKDTLELALVKENLTFRYDSWLDLDFARYSETKISPMSALADGTMKVVLPAN